MTRAIWLGQWQLPGHQLKAVLTIYGKNNTTIMVKMDTDKEQTEVKQPEQLSDLTEEDTTDVTQADPPNPDLEGAQEEQSYQSPPRERSNKKLFLTGAVITGLIALAVVGFFLTQRKNISQVEQTPQPTTTPTLSPTASPQASFDRSEWSLEVLNGTGVTGAAKKLADKLQDLGYKILKTGNADRSDYTKNELFVAKDMKDKQDLLLEDLKDVVKIASVAGQLQNSTASARIIIGKEL